MHLANREFHVLLMDPEPGALGWLIAALHRQGHRVVRTPSTEALLATLSCERPGGDGGPDLLVARCGGPSRSGLELLERLRLAAAIPCVLVAGTPDELSERVAALELGAEEYLHRGMPEPEMLVRVLVALRRTRRMAPASGAPGGAVPRALRATTREAATPITWNGHGREPARRPALLPGGWRLAPNRRALVVEDGRRPPIRLTGAEFELMRLLTAAVGEPVDRDAISRTVFRRPWRVEDRAVDGLVKRLRRKLEEEAIATGAGHRLRAALR